MVKIDKRRLNDLFAGFAGRRIAVVGDMMLDRYLWGRVARISPEAPVPVVEVDEESTRLGGAANVANNIASLGGIPVMIGVVGEDSSGQTLRKIMNEAGFPTDGVVVDPARTTTVKTRVIAHSQHVVRIDREVKRDIDPSVQKRILAVLESGIDKLEGIILQDYNKGVLVRPLIAEVTKLARGHRKIITVDPKFNNFFEYKDVTVFKPNRKETEEALSCRLQSEDDIQKAGREMLNRLGAQNVLLTMGEHGMVLFEKSGTAMHVPTAARNVADVSGAGDTVISTMTMALVAGADVREAATLANQAGGIVCGEVGIVPIDKEALRTEVLRESNHEPDARHG